MDELIPALDQLLKPDLPQDQRNAIHQQVYNALIGKLDRVDETKNTHLKKIIKLVGKKKYKEAQAAIMTKDKKSSPLIPILIIIALLVFLAVLWFMGKI